MDKKELASDYAIEVTSVGSYIEEIKKLKENAYGESTEFYFRGQEVDSWDIQPSIFRNNMLSVEDKLMKIPLQKNPFDFKDLDDSFDIMTKYQHYGMCTRLLDLTTNPLVALYFACKIHDSLNEQEENEPAGAVYFAKYYPTYQKDMNVKMITFLAQCDLSRENKVKDILNALEKENIITNELKNKWLQNFSDFIKILQSNYLVIPSYSNERLKKQSGVFLLVSMFTVNGTDPDSAIISKTKKDLRDEFEKEYFYIPGDSKKDIIKELDLLGINESTLFPELEHQLSYIKFIHEDKTEPVSDFNLYDDTNKRITDYSNVNEKKLEEEFINEVEKILKDQVNEENQKEIINIVKNSLIVDWYKRDSIGSKLKMNIITYCKSSANPIDEKIINHIISKIMTVMNTLIEKHMCVK